MHGEGRNLVLWEWKRSELIGATLTSGDNKLLKVLFFQLEINDSAAAASSKSSLRRANNFIAAVENSWKPENVKVPLSVVFHRRFWPLFGVWLTFDCQSPDMTKHHQDHA